MDDCTVKRLRIGILNPGEMGAAVGRQLTAAGRHVQWASEGRSEATRERARGLTDVGTRVALIESSDVILSICPPQAAMEVAASIAGFRGVYVDANAVSPGTARRIATVVELGGATYVDGGIVGPPPQGSGTTRVYLSGPHAEPVAELFSGSALDARVLSAEPTAASALKMTYAGWTKGSAALLIAIQRAASELGVAEALEAEWRMSRPDLVERADQARRAKRAKGWRWAPEMWEVADTLREAGMPPGFHAAAAEIFEEPED
jgi:3-hydroxyisobutyrate dehydrogenase-like beta-hydroxyacid dehydrogenase